MLKYIECEPGVAKVQSRRSQGSHGTLGGKEGVPTLVQLLQLYKGWVHLHLLNRHGGSKALKVAQLRRAQGTQRRQQAVVRGA